MKMPFPGEQLFCLRWNNYQANIVEVFDRLLSDETFTDVTLALDNGLRVKCHKMVLAACSTYFQGLFSALPCAHPIVVLKDITYTEIREILEFMYTGQVKVAEDRLAQFVRIANILQVKGLMANSTSSLTIARISPSGQETIELHPPAEENAEQTPENIEPVPGPSSAPHSTSSPHYGHDKSTKRNQRSPLPMWPIVPTPHNSPLDLAALQTSLAMNHSLFSSHYDNPLEPTASTSGTRKHRSSGSKKTNRNHDTPILRTVLGLSQSDSSMLHNRSDPHENNNHTNDSNNNNDDNDNNDTRRHNMETPDEQTAGSSHNADASMIMADDRRPPPPSFPGLSGHYLAATPVPAQRPEWKRYKQYTREDISNAIEAVRCGMSALRAARQYRVPSRTLYDKVKKLGITTLRPVRRCSTSPGASFPHGIGCNVNGSIYRNVPEIENNNSTVLMDNPAALLETAFAESRDESRDRESMMEAPRTSPSPQPLPLYAHRSSSAERMPPQEMTDDITDQVEDLSINRRSEDRDDITERHN